LEYADKTPEYETHSRKFILSASIGTSIPYGDFASTNVKNSFWDFRSIDSTHLQGFAQTGFHFNITATYMFNNNVGMIILLGNSTNSFDINTFSTSIGGFPASNLSGNYSTSEYLIGPCFSFPLAKKLNFKFNILIGLVNSNYPSINIALNDTTTYERDINGGSGFAYNLMGSFVYSITNSIGIIGSLSYMGSTILYPNWTETVTYTGYYPYSISHSTDVLNMKMGILKPTIGVEFRL
jgi:hypothetical protein